jgi:hypothetical protein
MKRAWFTWRARRLEAIYDGHWIISCPICGDGIPFNGAPRDENYLPHNVSVEPDGALTVSPSVVCGRGCGWHVTITKGKATP